MDLWSPGLRYFLSTLVPFQISFVTGNYLKNKMGIVFFIASDTTESKFIKRVTERMREIKIAYTAVKNQYVIFRKSINYQNYKLRLIRID